ncbi:membrane-bound lytic murein transglycosylase MltF [Salinisphaera sp. PC39]|uniref:membrane-bound lytic murein transglycosylase MltF n=1 Tax=Salinisphaera sp. PC39 TaxID=1304156 RepID=UPI0033404817
MRHANPGHRLRAFAMLAALAVAACSQDEGAPNNDVDHEPRATAGDLDTIREAGVLRIATRNAPTTYYINRDGEPAGPEYRLGKAFAESLGVEPEFAVYDSVSRMLAAVAEGRADLAAGGLTETDARRERFGFGPAYQTVRQQVVCRAAKPRKPADLVGLDLAVIAGSSYEERLSALQEQHPELAWQSVADVGTEQLLERVWREEIDCTVADSNIVDINRRYYPELLVMFNLGAPQKLAWPMPAGADGLRAAAESWLASFRESDRLAAVWDRYYGFIAKFDYVDKKRLVERIDERYTRYDHLFERAADSHGVPHGLLAAQAYQESHWDPDAVSPTGVRGIMMLTRATARELGVENRLDPAQSIDGGARYLRNMKKRLDEEIAEPDRTYFALAAYNVGLMHLRDAQKLAARQGLDPHEWRDVRETLPLLSDKRYYTRLKYGYARGTEPVRYVRRIRDYRDVIIRKVE